MREYYEKVFGLDVPLWQQYLNYWAELFQGNMGISVWLFPAPVTDVILKAVPYTLALLIPSILLSWCGREQGGGARRPAQVARQHGAAVGIRAHRHALHVAGHPARVEPRHRRWASSRSPAATASRCGPA